MVGIRDHFPGLQNQQSGNAVPRLNSENPSSYQMETDIISDKMFKGGADIKPCLILFMIHNVCCCIMNYPPQRRLLWQIIIHHNL